MRVIAGSAKGTRLYGAKGYRVRPITDRIKESLFDYLGDSVEGTRVLDLFAGVGSLGIEALSRGAAQADFVEKHRATANSIIKNLERSHLAGSGHVMVAGLPGGLSRAHGSYGLIFIDPPFRIEWRLLEEIFRLTRWRRLLGLGGIVIYRHSPKSGYEPPSNDWLMLERRDYGDSIVSIYKVSD
jgi:16S rRNA (guanine966-N2)-methyltransferase